MSETVTIVLIVLSTQAVVLYLLRRAAGVQPAPSRKGRRVLAYSRRIKVLGALGGIGVIALGALAVALAPTSEGGNLGRVLVGSFGIAFVALGGYNVPEMLWAWLEYDEAGLTSHSPWRRPRTTRWDEIVEVRFVQAAWWFVLRTTTGAKIRIPVAMDGIRQLHAELERRVPAERWVNDCDWLD